ncbi:hypothetical protein CASFOL_007518 [Castilleja foliolosa]|uniref:HTH myb-type domain-containing protein n=1 Tax=Castilleja foliolosa TaxID=1961234 RepID=A0ABD3EDA3_9LAMI
MGDKLNKANFDEGSIFVPKTISDILNKVSLISDFSDKSSEIDLFVRSFEDELRKVDAFKRELPLCMQLLKDGIEKLKEEKLQCDESETRAKINSEENGKAKMSNDFTEKRDWMSSVQLWSTPVQYENEESFLSLQSRYNKEDEANIGFFKNRGGGAFSPFKKAIEGVSLGEVESIDGRVREIRGVARPRPQQPHQNQPQRKQRRCWSPELHRLFVNALDGLGGAEVATPKQIREHMRVEGLTNDEVKSHLQKYRIHIRRIASGSPGPAGLPWLRQPQMDANSGSS